MRQIFRDLDLDNSFKRNGYVIVRQIVDIEKREKLKNFYSSIPFDKSNKIRLTNLELDNQKKSVIHKTICQEYSSIVESLLLNYEAVQGIFSNKPPHPESSMCMHRDWMLADENEFTTLSIWALLDGDTDLHGHLDIIPNSHKEHLTYRGRNFDFEIDKNRFSCNTETLKINAGDVILFDHKLVHGSSENLSESDRLASVLALIPQESPLLHYYLDRASEKIIILELDKEKFHLLDFTESGLPSHKRIHSFI